MKDYKIINIVTDEIIKDMVKLDMLVYQGNDIGVYEKCKDWVNINPDIYTVLMNRDEIVGYINFMPVTDVAYNQIKKGKLKDYELNSSHIKKFEKNKPLKCLFTSIVIKPGIKVGKEVLYLWKGFLDKITSLNVEISKVIMDCVTDIGEKCAIRYLDAKFITNSVNGKIYEGTLNLNKK